MCLLLKVPVKRLKDCCYQQTSLLEIPEPSGRVDRGTELCMGRQIRSFAMLLLLLSASWHALGWCWWQSSAFVQHILCQALLRLCVHGQPHAACSIA